MDRFIIIDSEATHGGNTLKNSFIVIHYSRFKQTVGLYTLQAPSQNLKVSMDCIWKLVAEYVSIWDWKILSQNWQAVQLWTFVKTIHTVFITFLKIRSHILASSLIYAKPKVSFQNSKFWRALLVERGTVSVVIEYLPIDSRMVWTSEVK